MHGTGRVKIAPAFLQSKSTVPYIWWVNTRTNMCLLKIVYMAGAFIHISPTATCHFVLPYRSQAERKLS